MLNIYTIRQHDLRFQVRRHGNRYHRLKTELDLSQRDVSVARAGFLRDCTQNRRGHGLLDELHPTETASRPMSVEEMHQTLSRLTRSADVSGRHSDRSMRSLITNYFDSGDRKKLRWIRPD